MYLFVSQLKLPYHLYFDNFLTSLYLVEDKENNEVADLHS